MLKSLTLSTIMKTLYYDVFVIMYNIFLVYFGRDKMKKKILMIAGLVMAMLFVIEPSYAEQTRIAGKNRYETAVNVSKAVFSQSDNVIIVSGEKFVDALAGSTLANILDAPILLVRKGSIPTETMYELKRINAQQVYLLGGSSTISDDVAGAFYSNGFDVQRIGGKDRYHTSELIYQEILKHTEVEEVALAAGEADAVSSGGYRGDNIPLILINDRAPSTYIQELDIQKTCLGSESVISEEAYHAVNASGRIGGVNRFDTAVKVAEKSNKENIVVVNGFTFIDALTGSVYAYQNDADILLTRTDALAKETAAYIRQIRPDNITILGSDAAVSRNAYHQINDIYTGKTIPGEPWKKAYRDLLELKLGEPIREDNQYTGWYFTKLQGDKEWGNSNELTENSRFGIHDLDNDGTPELLIYSLGEELGMDIWIYSYDGGTAPNLVEIIQTGMMNNILSHYNGREMYIRSDCCDGTIGYNYYTVGNGVIQDDQESINWLVNKNDRKNYSPWSGDDDITVEHFLQEEQRILNNTVEVKEYLMTTTNYNRLLK